MTESAERLRRALRSHPELRGKILRRLLIHLHEHRHASIEEIYRQARERLTSRIRRRAPEDRGENEGVARRWGERERLEIERVTEEVAGRCLEAGEVDRIVADARRQEEAEGLAEIARVPDVSFEVLADRLRSYCALPQAPSESEGVGVRVALVRHLLSDSLDYIGIAKKFFHPPDFLPIVDRTIGPAGGHGRIGGKAAGFLLAHRILAAPHPDGAIPVRMPESWFLRTDLFLEFFRKNGLLEYSHQKYRTWDEIERTFGLLQEVLKNAEMPEPAGRALRDLLESVGTHPLIVRSSSLLEDSFGAPFAGKYPSLFVANQGSLASRLEQLVGAIAEVYAGVLAPDPIEYRRKRNLLDYDEQMAVLVQEVVGFRYRDWFLPSFAGVAFSRNEHRWSPRIRKEDGLVRIVAGLGTRAVDRVGEDFPRMISLTSPSLRPEADVPSMVRYTQRYVDALNLRRNRFEHVRLADLLDPAVPFPGLDLVVSVHREGDLVPPVGSLVDADPSTCVVTFDNLIGRTSFFPDVQRILRRLEAVYGCPVDVEFAHDGRDLYLLQCRPQGRGRESGRVHLPSDVPASAVVFSASRDVPTGAVRDIEYVVAIDPAAYDRLEGSEARIAVGRTVGRVNRRLADRTFILVGPGRWGCGDLSLGVRVRYADLCHTRLLVEVAHRIGGRVPEPSFGTHFFQDLVETGIHYLPIHPEEPGVVFDEAFLYRSPSALASLLPESAELEPVVRVVHVPSIAGGRRLEVLMDGETDRALAYLTPTP